MRMDLQQKIADLQEVTLCHRRVPELHARQCLYFTFCGFDISSICQNNQNKFGAMTLSKRKMSDEVFS